MPEDRTLVPPGWYMLFVTDEQGTPSEAKWVKVASERAVRIGCRRRATGGRRHGSSAGAAAHVTVAPWARLQGVLRPPLPASGPPLHVPSDSPGRLIHR